ncbi:hypothetical protein O9992_09880 [Vibrio lentus]|nr:hypothetical protein [Vibrio lentus]
MVKTWPFNVSVLISMTNDTSTSSHLLKMGMVSLGLLACRSPESNLLGELRKSKTVGYLGSRSAGGSIIMRGWRCL